MAGHAGERSPAGNATPIAPVNAAGGASPAISIVIVTYNSARQLPACLASIRRATDEPWEAIVIDNASRDGTPDLLRGTPDVRAILNPTNRGFSAATNQGIVAARAETIVFLNPDTAVTPGWSRRMRAHLMDEVGAVGPVSNFVAGIQKLALYLRRPLEPTTSGDELAAVLAEQNGGVGQETKLLTGFCMMVPRSIIRRVGMLDEDLFLGNDDLEYSWRIRREGYRLMIATDTFVFHEGQESFKSEPESLTNRLVAESTEALHQKLQVAYGAGQVPAPETLWGVSWFQPRAFRHGHLAPEVAARALSVGKAGNPLAPLALFVNDSAGRVHVIGDDGGLLRGLGASRVTGRHPAGGTTAFAAPQGRSLEDRPYDLGFVSGLFGGCGDALAGCLLDELEGSARRGVVMVLPITAQARETFLARVGSQDRRAVPPAPSAWSPEALLARGYDGVELPDYWGFEGTILIMARWSDPADRERVRTALEGYYHPALLRFGNPSTSMQPHPELALAI